MKIEREKIPYRQGVIGLVIDNKNRLLLAQMQVYDTNQWRFPGGGIDEGETPEVALLREFKEELRSEKFKILKRSKYIIQYDWPEDVITKRYEKKGELFRGQQQIQFLVRYEDDSGEELDFDKSELRQVKWVNREELPTYLIFENQLAEAESALNELLDNIGKND